MHFSGMMLRMKIPPKANKNKTVHSVDIMSKMQSLLPEDDGVIKEKDDIIDKKSDVIAQQKYRIEILEEYLCLANSKRFAPSSEQTPEQDNLFKEAEISRRQSNKSLSCHKSIQ